MPEGSIGRHIRSRREANRWTQEELARRASLSVSYIGMLERGEKLPKLLTFLRIANTLQASADELLAEELDTGYTVTVTKYTERIGRLPKEERQRIYQVLDTMLRHAEKKASNRK